MTLVIIQPAAGADAQRHYHDTVVNHVSSTRIWRHLAPTQLEPLRKAIRGMPIRAWGVTPGKTGANYTRWQRIGVDDVVLFTGGNRVFSTARLVAKLHSRALAENLWGRDDDGMTWEYMYFITDVLPRELSYGAIAAAAGFKPSWVPLGFSVLGPDQSESVLALLD